jgi:hypothetical protein
MSWIRTSDSKIERKKAAHALDRVGTATNIIPLLLGVKLIICSTTFNLNYGGHNFLAIFGISTARNTQFLFFLLSVLKYFRIHICSLRLILNINFVVLPDGLRYGLILRVLSCFKYTSERRYDCVCEGMWTGFNWFEVQSKCKPEGLNFQLRSTWPLKEMSTRYLPGGGGGGG